MGQAVIWEVVRTVTGYLKNAARRFLNNTPKNKYEDIIFQSIRTAASEFGRVRRTE